MVVKSGKLRQGGDLKRGKKDYPHQGKRLTFCQKQEFYQEKLLTFPPDRVDKLIVDNYIYEKLLTIYVPKVIYPHCQYVRRNLYRRLWYRRMCIFLSESREENQTGGPSTYQM